MNKLKTLLCAVFTLMLVNLGAANSDSSNFAGPYVGFQLLGLGAEFSGSSTSGQGTANAGNSAAETDQLPVGATVATVGIELGYAIPIGSGFVLDLGGQYLSGEAKIDHENSTGTDAAGNVSLTMDDHYTYYIAPTIVLSETSSLYIKAGVVQADVNVTGDVQPTANLHGEMWAVGTRTVLPSGIFIRTEAGYTEYNDIGTRGKGEGTQGANRIGTDTTFTAKPTIVHGNISLGFRF
jgi:hypothetical protein